MSAVSRDIENENGHVVQQTPSSVPQHDSESFKHKSSSDLENVNVPQQHAGQDAEKETATTPVPADVPPNGGYGWVCVAATFWINAHTWGLNSAYAVFLAYYLRTDTFPGATRLEYALIGGLSVSMALLIAPIATTTTRLLGTRWTLLIGVFFETASFIGASFVKEIWQLFLSQGVCFGWGMGFLFVGTVSVIPQWFTTRRSLANGIAASGSGLGGLIYSLAANRMIETIGLPWAFRVLGIIACIVNVTCALLMRDRNRQVGSRQVAFDYTLFRRFEFLVLELFGVFSMLGYIVLLFSLPNYANSIGLTPMQGSIVGALFQLGQGLGRPPIGYFSDNTGRLNMAGLMTFLAGLFCLVIWVFAKSYGVLIFYGILVGTVAGTYWAVIAPVTAEVVGLRDVPSALSINWLVLVLPTTFAEAIALQITTINGGKYLGAQLFAGFMYMGAALCIVVLRVWKVRQVEKEEEGKAREEISGVDAVSTRTAKSNFAKNLGRVVKWKRV